MLYKECRKSGTAADTVLIVRGNVTVQKVSPRGVFYE